MNKLIIVESPAKCKKIEEYLGHGYKCMASYGHLREISDLSNIHINEGYKPYYNEINNPIKKRQIHKLRDEIRLADEVILATDDDREGEAIAWHICDMFGLSILTTKRIIFHEITQSALLNALQTPRIVDINLVYAQQARQIMDLLVGFKTTPTLWKWICSNKENPLSSGRCQTPALRLIFDNDIKIKEQHLNDTVNATSIDSESYNVVGYFTHLMLSFELNKPLIGRNMVEKFLLNSIDFENRFIKCSSPKKVIKDAPIPLTTSYLQQTANSDLHIGVKDIMKIAQTLYEKGFITYMRTDNAKYSLEFIHKASHFIKTTWGENYVQTDVQSKKIQLISSTAIDTATVATKTKPKSKKTKGIIDTGTTPLIQGAHEAIRPTDAVLTPYNFMEITKNDKAIGIREHKLYKLIWQHTIASCMASSITETITARISACVCECECECECSVGTIDLDDDITTSELCFQRHSNRIVFSGWKNAYELDILNRKVDRLEKEREKDMDEENECQEWRLLQLLHENTLLPYKKMEASIILKTVSGHYTESNLVKILEEIGIGRPSTFAMLVDKIQEREYVKMDTIKPIKLNCLEYVLNKDNKMFQTKIVQKETGGEKNKLLLQPIGRIVSDFLEKHFSDIFNYKYTKQMEDGLDMIAKGNKQMTELCSECDTLLEKCLNSLKSSGLKKIQHRFNSTHTFLISKMGPCIHTSNPERFISVRKEYKDNFNMEMFDKIQKGEIKLEDMMEIADVSDIKVISVNVKSNEDIQNETQKQIMQNNITFYELGLYNGMKIFIKTGKYGPFVSLENVCQSTELLYGGIGKKTKKPVITVTKPFKTISLKSLGENRGLDSYTYDEIVEIIEGKNTLINPNILREISVNMSIRRGPKGSLYIYFKNDSIKKPMFYKLKGFTDDPIICPLETLQDWIKQKYNVY